MEKGDNLVFIGKKEHLASSNATFSVALDVWTERELIKLQTEYISAEPFVPRGEKLFELSSLTDTIAREWYRRPSAESLRYKELSIGEALEPMMVFYLGRFFYYLHTVEGILKSRAHIASVRVDDTFTITPDTAGVFAQFEQRALVDAVHYCCKKYGIRAESEPYPVQKQQLFPESKARVPLVVWNWCLSLLPSKTSRLYVSDYWSHMASFLLNMDDTEVVFMDRKEIQQTPFLQLMKHRIRFMHPLDNLKKSDVEVAENVSREFLITLESVRTDLKNSPWFTYADINWFPLFDEVLVYAVGHYSQRLVAEYEAFSRIFRKQQIQKILLRASIGGRQHHFFLITRVARELGIPTIELQHANEVVEGSSVHSRLAADYLASYGKGTRDILVRNHGYEPDRIREIGSPRFDRYALHKRPASKVRENIIEPLTLDSTRPIVFVGMSPEIVDLYFVHFDSYTAAHFLKELHSLMESIPGVQLILKFRGGNLTDEYRAYCCTLFPENVYLAEYEDPFTLMQISDVVLSPNSTLFYEAMQSGTPAVLYPLRSHDCATKEEYKAIAPTPDTLPELVSIVGDLLNNLESRQELVVKQKQYLRGTYSFDGKATERTIALLREDLVAGRGV